MKAVLILLLFASAVLAKAQDQDEAPDSRRTAAVNQAQAACGPFDTHFDIKLDETYHSLSIPEPGKALVYVIEEQKFRFLNDVTVRIGLDGAWVGANRGNSYFSFSVNPGEHHLCGDWKIGALYGGNRLVTLAGFTTEAGKVYFFRARASGAKDEEAILDLDLVNSDEGQLLVAASALSNAHAKK